MPSKFNNEKLKEVAEKHFGGVQGLHTQLVQAGILLNIGTLSKWCYSDTSPNLNNWWDVYNFLVTKIPKLKKENFIS